MARVFVTGAGGFIGSAAAAHLAGPCGHDVIASARAWGAPDRLPPGIERQAADLLDEKADWAAAFAGVDAIVHCAALVHHAGRGQGDAAFNAVNAAAVERVARAAAQAGVRRFVLVSSIAVHGRRSAVGIHAGSPVAPADAYARSKLAGEEVLSRVCAQGLLTAVIVRPPLVHGPGAPGNFARLASLLRRGWPLPVANTPNRRSVLGVGNLADFIARVGLAPTAGGAYVVADAETVSTATLIEHIAQAMTRPPRLIRLPPALIDWGARAIGRAQMADSLTGSLWVDPLDARRAGWSPPVSLDAGLAAAVRQPL